MPFVHDDHMDAALNHLLNRAPAAINAINYIYLCAAGTQPTTLAEAQASMVVRMAVDTTNVSAFTIVNGATNGRKISYAGKTSASAEENGGYHAANNSLGLASGQVNFAVWVNETGSPTLAVPTTTGTIQFINNITGTQVSENGAVTINAFDMWEISDPI